MKYRVEDIEDLYREQAEKHGAAGTSTIQDMRTRNLEIRAIFKRLRDGLDVLEIGCGNGFVAEEIANNFDLNLEAFDFSTDLIEIAKGRDLSGKKGTVNFQQADVLEFQYDKQFDVVFSERCIQNLVSWDQQKVALKNIANSIKPGGIYVMLESFWTGLNNLNEARAELGLDAIPEHWHNMFFVEEDVKEHLTGLQMECVETDPFLSGYYFGSRVLLPKLLDDPSSAKSSSRLNDFFCELPPAGDFSPMKILVFAKDG